MWKATSGWVVFLMLGSLLLLGCGTTKQFQVTSVPEAALVLVHEELNPDTSPYTTPYGPTPASFDLLFLDDDYTYYVSLEKRGYERSTRRVDKESAPLLNFEMQKIAGVPDYDFDRQRLKNGRFVLLPAAMDIFIHSGVGALDKRSRSEEHSRKVSRRFDAQLRAYLKEHNSRFESPPAWDDALKRLGPQIAEPLKAHLAKIDYQRLPYYSRPVIVECKRGVVYRYDASLSPRARQRTAFHAIPTG